MAPNPTFGENAPKHTVPTVQTTRSAMNSMLANRIHRLRAFVASVSTAVAGALAVASSAIPQPTFPATGSQATTSTRPANNPGIQRPFAKEIATDVRWFLARWCVRCHQNGAVFRIDTLNSRFEDPSMAQRWEEIAKVLDAHQMPPKAEPPPPSADSARIAVWIHSQLADAEISQRPPRTVLRRLNRDEVNRTLRDLTGVDLRPADHWPEDPQAGGFRNNGAALAVAPLHLELLTAAGRQVVGHALAKTDGLPSIRWRFEPEENTRGMDQLRVQRGPFRILLNDGANPTENGFTVIHHASWDKNIDFRDFRLPTAGTYVVRIRAAGRIPRRDTVVRSASHFLGDRLAQQQRDNPGGKVWQQREYDHDLAHFRTHRMYDYGPPRIKLTRQLGGQPEIIAEFDVDANPEAPKVFAVEARFTTESAGIQIEYAYDIPEVLENAWMQRRDDFARPELLVDWVEIEGPVAPTGLPDSRSQLAGTVPDNPVDEVQAARQVLARFLPRAWRRPVTPAELERKVVLFKGARQRQKSFLEAIQIPLAAAIASPNFLYLAEPIPTQGKPRKLGAFALANRLSYFLWSTMPDEALTTAAKNGSLLRPEAMRQQVDRMLRHPNAAAFVENFTRQWLGLDKIGANPPARNLYPEYDRHLEKSMAAEPAAFVAELLRSNKDLRNLVRSDFVVVNERLARFYGIPGVRGDHFRKVPVGPQHHRGGIPTMAAIHTITSNGTRTSPVARGTWILRTLLGTDPGLPVANVGEIPGKVPGIDKATIRKRLELHRSSPACARCHDSIDPLGFALENYDACGEWREQEGHGYNGRIEADDPRIDTTAKMPNGRAIAGIQGLQQALLDQDDLFLRQVTQQLATYALGRELGHADQVHTKEWIKSLTKQGATLRNAVQILCASETFHTN
jgi:hypothetical protein